MKNTKIVALVATAAILVLGAAFTSFAAAKYNWYQVDGIWHCADKNGDDICEDFAKSGNDMYYLDENGEMVTEAFIEYDDDHYYFDADGKMAKNQWEKIENTEDDDGDDYYWYYFQASGKAKKGKVGAYGTDNKPVSINGKKYVFDTDGKMQYGWVGGSDDDYPWEDAVFYAGDADDGAVRTGWAKIDVEDRREDFEEQSYWFWFGTNGQKFVSSNTHDELAEKTINGKKYAFDDCGVMKAEWGYITTMNETDPIASNNIAGYAWFQDAETGAKLKKGWFRVIPKDKVDKTNADDEEIKWFYAKGSGELAKGEIKSINGKKYAFNWKGEMLSGLYKFPVVSDAITVPANDDAIDDAAIDTEDKVKTMVEANNDPNYAVIFFGDEETDGSMKTGTVKVDVDGEEYTFLFDSTGANKFFGHQGVKGSAMYFNGSKLKADSDLKYQAYEANFPAGDDYKLADVTIYSTVRKYNDTAAWTDNEVVLVSASGAIVKSGTKKDADDHKYYVKNYKVSKAPWN